MKNLKEIRIKFLDTEEGVPVLDILYLFGEDCVGKRVEDFSKEEQRLLEYWEHNMFIAVDAARLQQDVSFPE